MNEINIVAASSVCELDQFCMALLVAMYLIALLVSRQSEKIHPLVGWIVGFFSLSIVTNDIWVLGEAGVFTNLTVQNTVISVYFVSLTAATAIWTVFAFEVADLRLGKKRFCLYPVLLLPAFIVAFLSVTAPFNRWLFYFNEAGKYVRGPLYNVHSFISYGYIGILALVLVIAVFRRRGKSKTEPIALLSGVATVILFYTLQFLTTLEFSVVGVSTALIIYCAYVIVRTLNAQRRELRKKQGELEEALSMAQSANRAKTVFLNSMSHDIRTPMNAITGFTRMANTHIEDTEAVRGYLGKIESASGHLLSLINDVLDMSRIESGKVTLTERPESLCTLFGEAADLAEEGAVKKRLTLERKIDVSRDFVLCDKLRLKQILLNLLSNSVKYTPEGGTVTFSVTEEEGTEGIGRYVFRVSDNGIGMSPEFLKTIYEPFNREQSSTVSGIQGTGLGMAITKNLVEMMAGTIDARSEEGKGTEITVRLGFSVCENEADEETSVADFSFAGKKVLLVEDNELNREIAVDLLTEEGFSVDTAEDGTVAVEKMKNAVAGQYDLVLMDIQMPIMNGYDAARAIRAMADEDERNAFLRTLPIVAMTANAFEEDRRQAFAAGMNEHIAKPIDVKKLKETLARFLA